MNAKIYNGNVQPNHKEYKIWVNDEGIIKTWNGTKWIEQSGGSGESGGGEASTVEYLDVSGRELTDTVKILLVASAISVKITFQGNIIYMPPVLYEVAAVATIEELNSVAKYLAIDFNLLTYSPALGKINLNDLLVTLGVTQEQLDAIPRITKEQFYSLE